MQRHDSVLVLHVRSYRETSVIAQFFTEDQGRIAGVMRAAKRKGQTAVQPFMVGMLEHTGRSNLVTVTKFERTHAYALNGDALVAGFYVLELVTRLLDERQADPNVFHQTHDVLAKLSATDSVAESLRHFEFGLLNELGYGIDFRTDATTGEAILDDAAYTYRNEFGFAASRAGDTATYPGWVVNAIGTGDYSDPRVAKLARRIVRQALAPLLGPKPLVSRKMLARRKQSL